MPTNKAEYMREYRRRNPAKVNATNQRYRARNKEKYRAMSTAASWRRNNFPTPTRPRPEICECCGLVPNGRGTLHLDHDHVTGEFRGWLCYKCNAAIGLLGDNVAGVRAALIYLEKIPDVSTT